VLFWYRQSPQALVRRDLVRQGAFLPSVSDSDPPVEVAGEVIVYLDTDGRLRRFEAVPANAGPSSVGAPDWSVLFRHADLDISVWTGVESGRTPPFFADSRTAWSGALPGAPDIPVRVEAAGHQGRPVSFEIVAPWTQALEPYRA
jgi:hypothetical protein